MFWSPPSTKPPESTTQLRFFSSTLGVNLQRCRSKSGDQALWSPCSLKMASKGLRMQDTCKMHCAARTNESHMSLTLWQSRTTWPPSCLHSTASNDCVFRKDTTSQTSPCFLDKITTFNPPPAILWHCEHVPRTARKAFELDYFAWQMNPRLKVRINPLDFHHHEAWLTGYYWGSYVSCHWNHRILETMYKLFVSTNI